ncbi:DHA1 family tetracycline resistance protein-like MFS transporter [Pseudaminobacter salicylatoxidans]|uniref:DHA1 family tetracycline resistance protein-like MFS transporter n=1 Tax=Pseudaminobacter salicylatoxidans TaxID=93369 RepID=A0A316BLB9_PSESE|nr:TCR/Tet family MFS transporter [Pseudaminobacter salicylatoxidans]PWJ73584.1 DHA1 family tetracycline resistance protein-like MFS transporter [Pseudaminobacter salicylatoxidans]
MSILSGSRRKAAIAFIMVTAVLDIVAMGIIIPVLPPLIEEFAGSNAEAGWINGVFVALWAGMQFVASPIIGSLSDQHGRRPVILLSTLGLAADYVLMALAPNLWWLALGRIIAGITSSSFTTVFAYMADITAPEERARGYGLIGAAFSAGFVAGPLLGGVLGEISPRAPFWFAAGMSGIAFLYGLFVLPESLAPAKRMTFSWKRANPFGAMMLLRSHPELSGLAVVTFLLHFSHHVFSAVFVLYAGYRFGWHAWEVGTLLALVGLLDMTVQGVLVGPMVKRFGDRATMVFGLFGGAIGIAWMGLAPTGVMFTLAMLPNALWGLAMPTLQSLMTQRVSESEQGQLQGANMSVASIAGVVSPLFFGAVYAFTLREGSWLPYPGASFLIASLVLLGAALLGWAVARQANRRAGQALP